MNLGDSGGPLFLVDKQKEAVCVYGVVNYGWDTKCGDKSTTSAAARVSYYIGLFEQDGEVGG